MDEKTVEAEVQVTTEVTVPNQTTFQPAVSAEATPTVSPDTVAKAASGQARKPRGLEVSQLNDNERTVMEYLDSNRVEVTISELATGCFASAPTTAKARSWTRNALRRLVSEGFVDKPSRGKYLISHKATHELGK